MELDRKFLKKLWDGEKVICPKCNKDYLVPLHKKRKDNDDFKCVNCNEIYRTINIFNNILIEEKNTNKESKTDKKMLKKIYSHCECNKKELLKVKKCGCFNCKKIFNTKEIKEWIKFNKNEEYTGFCPFCHIDSLIPESDEYELKKDLLEEIACFINN